MVLVQNTGKLVDGRGNLDALLEDGTLSLDANITRPLHHAGEILLGLHSATNAVVTFGRGEQVLMLGFPVLLLGRLGGSANFRGCCDL